MQNPKTTLFLYLTSRQKAQLLSTLKAYCSNNPNLSNYDLIDKFLYDEKYYLEINNPHFEFLKSYFDDDLFLKELKLFFDWCIFEREEKEKLKPFLDKQKEFQKEQRKKVQEFKMSKLKPTKKQLLYYDKLTKAHNIKKKDTENATRLDLRNWIMTIIDGTNKDDETN